MKKSRAELKMRARRALAGNYGNLILAMLVMVLVSWAISTIGQAAFVGSGILSSVLTNIGTGTFSSGEFAGISWRFPGHMYIVTWILGLLSSWVTVLLTVGMNRMCISLGREGRTDISQIWWAFKNHPVRFCLLQLFIYLLVCVAILPVIVLTIALAFSLGGAAISRGANYGQVLFLVLFLLIYGLILAAVCLLVYLNYGLVYYVMADHPDMGVFQSLGETHRIMKGNRFRFLVLQLSFIGWKLLVILTAGIGALWINPYIRCTFAMFYLDIREPEVETIPPGRDYQEMTP